MKKPICTEHNLQADYQRLRQELHDGHELIPHLRDYRLSQEAQLQQAYEDGDDILSLIQRRTLLIDMIIQLSWEHYQMAPQSCCLMAVGGYGRRELLPYSDIDLSLIISESLTTTTAIEAFIAALWDMGLQVGHHVATIPQCQQLAREDVAVITSLLECRYLLGDKQLYQQLKQAISPKNIWSSQAFLRAKQQEQKKRQEKFGGSSYNLEPNIKNGPGGLRDIQTILWIGKRHFSKDYDKHLVELGFLTPQEFNTLQAGQRYLWHLRCALHYEAKRQEERLLFNYQSSLAKKFGYQDKPNELAIEQFMKMYYRTVKHLNELNDMLVQLFREEIIYQQQEETIVPLNARFQIHNDYIEVVHDDVFQQTPSALLEIFTLMAEYTKIKGVRASTIRLIRQHRHLINDKFRQDSYNQDLLMSLFTSQHNISQQLRRMNRYGILDDFIPGFKHIIGQMQYDLFHVYTVDQHLISVVNNIYEFTQGADKFPLAHELVQTIPQRSTLYLAALFHDIGKGQGGDHSLLGAEIIKDFCQAHQLEDAETELLIWLVEHHLLMSSTAQRQDIYDPEILANFAKAVASMERLNYLYLLTVADICGTNPKLWTQWKDNLLQDLYRGTAQYLSQTQQTLPAMTDIQNQVFQLLQPNPMERENIQLLWQHWRQLYFYRTKPKAIARHTKAILNHSGKDKPLVLIHNETMLGATEIFIYMPSQNYHFATTTVILDRLNLNIMEAQITSTRDHYKMDTYYITDREGKPVADGKQLENLRQTLFHRLNQPLSRPRPIQRKMSRRLQHFTYPTKISFHIDPVRNRTNMEVITPDRPGLLARISMALVDCKILLQGAKIATLGERVEDMFFITDQLHHPLTEATQNTLKQRICHYLDVAQ